MSENEKIIKIILKKYKYLNIKSNKLNGRNYQMRTV